MKRLLCYLKEYRKESLLSPLFKLLEASFELLVPLVIASIINKGIRGNNTDVIVKMGLVLLLLATVGLVSAVFAQYFAAKAAVGFAASVRKTLFACIQKMSYEEIDQNKTSTLISRMTSDVVRVQTGVNLTLRLLLRSPFIVFGSMIMAFVVDEKLAWIFVIVIPILFAIVFAVLLTGIPMYKKVQHSLDRVLVKVRENLSGVRVIRAFCREEKEQSDFYDETDHLKTFQLVAGRIGAVMNPMTYLVINASVLAILYLGGNRVGDGRMDQGEVVALLNYMAQILVELIKLANLLITMIRAMASADRISEILRQKDQNQDKELAQTNSIETIQTIQIMELKNVAYAYPDASSNVLEQISFKVQKGEILGIIGGTGSGKSTLSYLLTGFLPASEGEVFINGQTIQTYDTAELRKCFGIVPQHAVLFRGTVRENLLWGDKNAGEKEMQDALIKAQAWDFISKKEHKTEAEVLQNGSNFSGGQRQRLAIARAMIRKPEVLILDDSTSALDYLTESQLRQSLIEEKENRITVIISQRTSSVRQADKILVLNEGTLCGIGTHEELLKTNVVYQEIYASQYGDGQEVKHA